MFQSDLVDFFSRTHWSAIPALFLPGAIVPFAYGLFHEGLLWSSAVSVASAGFVTWTLVEYWLHRTFFHWHPGGTWGDRMHFWVHGVHHLWPHDRFRLVMPPAVGLSLYCLCLGIFHLLLGSRWAWCFHAGFVLGYVHYDLMHYYLHHGRPRHEYLKRLKRHHLLHHFKDDRSRFGVSNRGWDWVFGTEGSKLPTPETRIPGPGVT